MTPARTQTRQRREKMLARARTVGELEEALPLNRQIVHIICWGIQSGACVCARSPDKPPCEQMETLAGYIIDTVRRHDMKAD